MKRDKILPFEREKTILYEILYLFCSKNTHKISKSDQSIQYDNLIIRPKERRILMDEEEINLSCLEFDTLLYLIRNMDLVLIKEQIYEAVWKHETDDYINAVTCVIYKLRMKIEPDPSHPKYLQTVRGVGYRLSSL